MINRIAGLTTGPRQKNGVEDSSWPIKTSDLKRFIDPVESYISQRPAAAVAAAFVIGVALAWWIKRK